MRFLQAIGAGVGLYGLGGVCQCVIRAKVV